MPLNSIGVTGVMAMFFRTDTSRFFARRIHI